MKKLLSILFLLSTFPAHSLDVITSPYQLLVPCYKPRTFRQYSRAFCFTIKLTDDHLGNPKEKPSFARIFSYIVSLPFMFLDEDQTSINFDPEILSEQGYSEEEIDQISLEIQLLTAEAMKQRDKPIEVLILDLKEQNKLSDVTIEVFGL